MNTIQIEEALERLVLDIGSGACTLHDFPFRLMEAYDASRNEVSKLRMRHPAGLVATDVLWPKKMLYRPAAAGGVQAAIEALKASLVGRKGAAAKNAPRFLVSTDGDEFLAVDVRTGETSGFDRLADLPVNYDYLMPMFGVERYKPAAETVADVRAARQVPRRHTGRQPRLRRRARPRPQPLHDPHPVLHVRSEHGNLRAEPLRRDVAARGHADRRLGHPAGDRGRISRTGRAEGR